MKKHKKHKRKKNLSFVNEKKVPRGPHIFEKLPQNATSQFAYIYKSEFEFISKCILDYPNVETGGQLFGYWRSDNCPVVLYAIGPGPNANHQIAFFNQDVKYLLDIGNILVHHYGLQHIGEWHSHHQLGLAQPSGHDAATMADTIHKKNLGKFLLCIGNCTDTETTLSPFNFFQTMGYDYMSSRWYMLNIESPFRQKIDSEMQHCIIHPRTLRANYSSVNIEKTSVSSNFGACGYWFEKKENRIILNKIIEHITYESMKKCSCSVQLDENKQVHLYLEQEDRTVHFHFGGNFPGSPPSIVVNGEPMNQQMEWNYNGDIYSSFINYYKTILL